MNDNDFGPRIPVEVLTEKEACETLRISRSTLRRLVDAGRLSRSGVSRGRRLFWIGEIRRVAATPLVTVRGMEAA
jgi:excisionase family DNA binding protein